eukprot:CAMPEP_0177766234 /NCGR_PEP_ID=MMETSP0491_2-20121128/8419_1 /TAXON_ID=63592 /ORGANISM="Tetraselmis chuii, Strain PLY429" /LENGTH=139 /DNA_ID=CAMNT_0019282641 /DNA_START=250 /DNA_END=665 /DNA_ORIENTATION=-
MGCVPSVINQVSTDLDQPPEFKVVKCRDITPQDSLIQQRFHPDVKPFTTNKDPSEAFAAAKAVCREMFTSVVDVREELMEVECVDVTKLMRFKDDVLVRVTKAGEGARVDIRSASRVGKSDLGKNAERVQKFTDALRAR